MSNEEWAAHLLETDIINNNLDIPPEDIVFMRKLILGTTFAQGKPFLTENDPKYRPYKADTVEEKLLVFADVG